MLYSASGMHQMIVWHTHNSTLMLLCNTNYAYTLPWHQWLPGQTVETAVGLIGIQSSSVVLNEGPGLDALPTDRA